MTIATKREKYNMKKRKEEISLHNIYSAKNTNVLEEVLNPRILAASKMK